MTDDKPEAYVLKEDDVETKWIAVKYKGRWYYIDTEHNPGVTETRYGKPVDD